MLSPLTKLVLTFIISFYALITNDLILLSLLYIIEIIATIFLPKTKTLGIILLTLIGFSCILCIIQLICGSDMNVSLASGFKMLIMATALVLLLQTTSTRQLTATLVHQLHLPYSYAFMITAILRFIPDILQESKFINDAQSCRGFKPSKNPFCRLFDYMMIIKPMVFKAISRSENMALSLQMRGFNSTKQRVFIIDTSLKIQDYIYILVSIACIYFFI